MSGPLCKQISDLIDTIAALPGLSHKSATRLVAHIFSNWNESMIPLYSQLKLSAENIKKCEICWNFSTSSPCAICLGSNKRNRNEICIVEDVGALWSIERRRLYNGMYHVLGGVLSATAGISPRDLNLSSLLDRIRECDSATEIIIAIPPSIESGITIEYVLRAIRSINTSVTISKISQGIPSGVRVENVDDATISAALMSRLPIG